MAPGPHGSHALIFDLDGVLVDSRRPIARSLNHALERHGLEALPEAELHRFIGPPLHAACGELLAAQAADPSLADSCVAAYRERYRELFLDETCLVPGIAAAVERLAPGRVLAVASSKPLEFSRPLLERLGLLERFHALFGPPLSARGETKTRTLGRALRALGLAGKALGKQPRAVLIGDRRHDVEAARAHALESVGVGWGIGSEAELRAAGVDHFVATPAELVALLEGLPSR